MVEYLARDELTEEDSDDMCAIFERYPEEVTNEEDAQEEKEDKEIEEEARKYLSE